MRTQLELLDRPGDAGAFSRPPQAVGTCEEIQVLGDCECAVEENF